MAELLGGIQRALGSALAGIYSVTHSYALGIILLTLAVRALLIPLTVKQIRSMTAMQKLAPEQKKIQQKYKQLQQKAKDRSEVQQLRLQMNQEVQQLFRQHGVNPLGGCLPLVAQMPVFVAMFSIMRAAIIAIPLSVSAVAGSSLDSLPTGREAGKVICRPSNPVAGDVVEPQPAGSTPTEIHCFGEDAKDFGRFRIADLREGRQAIGPKLEQAGWIGACRLTGDKTRPFACASATGTGHLPRDSKLFADVSLDRATVLGMHPGCAPSQVSSTERIRECTTREKGAGGGGAAVPYYVLVGLIVVTSYYQSKQMSSRATGPQLQQQQMMTRIMPVLFGFISLSIPAGANLYFLATNVWTIGQQHLLLTRRKEEAKPEESKPTRGEAPKEKEEAPKPHGSGSPQGSRRKRKRKRRR